MMRQLIGDTHIHAATQSLDDVDLSSSSDTERPVASSGQVSNPVVEDVSEDWGKDLQFDGPLTQPKTASRSASFSSSDEGKEIATEKADKKLNLPVRSCTLFTPEMMSNPNALAALASNSMKLVKNTPEEIEDVETGSNKLVLWFGSIYFTSKLLLV